MTSVVGRTGQSGFSSRICSKGWPALLGAFLALLTFAPALAADWVVTPLHTFDDALAGAGIGPRGNLALGADGALYGATETGGASGVGSIFKLTKNPNGTWKHTRLFSFTAAANGALPQSGVVFGKDGALYGTTTRVGAKGTGQGGGTVYRLAKVGSAWSLTVLHHFNPNAGEGSGNRGVLAFDAAGNIYGTTTNSDGSFPGEGIVYRLKRPTSGAVWTFQKLHAFAGGNGGKDPEGGVLIGANGVLYGVSGGSSTTPGTLYKLTPNAGGTVWTHQVLHLFVVPESGRYPNGTLARDTAGILYGVTFSGGLLGPNFQQGGVVFSYSPAGAFKVIYRFLTKPDDGYGPMAGPILRGDFLYGTTARGAPGGDGTVYRLTKQGSGAWTETVLRGFDGPTEGSALRGPVLVTGAGLFYGTAANDGPKGGGTVFRIAPPPP